MRIGSATTLIEVPLGSQMGGYSFRRTGVEGMYDPLLVQALSLDDEHGTRVAIVLVDVVAINADVAAEARAGARVLGFDDLWISATHTHSGPDTGCVPGGSVTPHPWIDVLPTLIVGAAAQAMEREQPMEMRWAQSRVVGVGGVRTGVGQETPLPVGALVMNSPDGGGTRAALVSLPCHPTVLGPTNTWLSADLNGAVRRALAEGLSSPEGTRPWVGVATGPAGDISTRHRRRDRSFAECNRLGRIIAEQILQGIAGSTSLPMTGASQRIQSGVVHLQLPHRSERIDSTCTDSESLDAAAANAAASGGNRTIELEVSSVAIGGVSLVSIPGELFLASGLELMKAAERPLLVLGYTNGYVGYIPPAVAYRRNGYEVMVSPFEAGSGEDLVEKAVRLIRVAAGRLA